MGHFATHDDDVNFYFFLWQSTKHSIPKYSLSGLCFFGIINLEYFFIGSYQCVQQQLNSSAIIKKIYFPRLIIPVSAILVALFDFLMAFILFVLLVIYYQQPISWAAVWSWPLALAISVVATLGLGCWLAALNVKYRDFRYVIPFMVQVLFFLTPVIYPLTLLKYPLLQYVLAASPMFAAVELFRYPITGVLPNLFFTEISLSSGFLLLLIGIFYFRRTEDFFADFA
jgi:lipopolysaccharide transport system permease protein